jgi:hypothetical protein
MMMKTNAPFRPAPATSPSPKKLPWWLYALGALAALLLLAAVALAILVGHYTSKKPMPIAQAAVTEEERTALIAKWMQFHQDVPSGRPAAPFQVSPKELKVFLSSVPQLKDRVLLDLEQSQMRAEASIPLEQVLPVFGKGRYLNAVGRYELKLEADKSLRLDIRSATLNGKALPRWMLSRIASKSLDQGVLHTPDVAAFLARLKSLEIHEGCLVFVPTNAI